MKVLPCLSRDHISILVKMQYFTIDEVAESEGMSLYKINKLRKDALICIRKALDGAEALNIEAILKYMAQRCNQSVDNITQRLCLEIADCMESRDSECWSEIRDDGKPPTPEDLLRFIVARYDCNRISIPYGIPF